MEWIPAANILRPPVLVVVDGRELSDNRCPFCSCSKESRYVVSDMMSNMCEDYFLNVEGDGCENIGLGRCMFCPLDVITTHIFKTTMCVIIK